MSVCYVWSEGGQSDVFEVMCYLCVMFGQMWVLAMFLRSCDVCMLCYVWSEGVLSDVF